MNYFRKKINLFYDKVRKLYPANEFVYYSGINIGERKFFLNRFVPGFRNYQTIDDYEYTTILAQRQNIRPGDNIVVIGGGWGVTACTAAQLTGKTGSVTVFEGNLQNVELIKRTSRLNGVTNVEVIEGIVGNDVGVYFGAKSRKIVNAGALPACDVLEMDCEGSELEILKHLATRPRVVICETHGMAGSPTTEVINLLIKKGYEAFDLGVAEPRVQDLCVKEDIRIVVGKKVEYFYE